MKKILFMLGLVLIMCSGVFGAAPSDSQGSILVGGTADGEDVRMRMSMSGSWEMQIGQDDWQRVDAFHFENNYGIELYQDTHQVDDAVWPNGIRNAYIMVENSVGSRSNNERLESGLNAFAQVVERDWPGWDDDDVVNEFFDNKELGDLLFAETVSGDPVERNEITDALRRQLLSNPSSLYDFSALDDLPSTTGLTGDAETQASQITADIAAMRSELRTALSSGDLDTAETLEGNIQTQISRLEGLVAQAADITDQKNTDKSQPRVQPDELVVVVDELVDPDPEDEEFEEEEQRDPNALDPAEQERRLAASVTTNTEQTDDDSSTSSTTTINQNLINLGLDAESLEDLEIEGTIQSAERQPNGYTLVRTEEGDRYYIRNDEGVYEVRTVTRDGLNVARTYGLGTDSQVTFVDTDENGGEAYIRIDDDEVWIPVFDITETTRKNAAAFVEQLVQIREDGGEIDMETLRMDGLGNGWVESTRTLVDSTVQTTTWKTGVIGGNSNLRYVESVVTSGEGDDATRVHEVSINGVTNTISGDEDRTLYGTELVILSGLNSLGINKFTTNEEGVYTGDFDGLSFLGETAGSISVKRIGADGREGQEINLGDRSIMVFSDGRIVQGDYTPEQRADIAAGRVPTLEEGQSIQYRDGSFVYGTDEGSVRVNENSEGRGTVTYPTEDGGTTTMNYRQATIAGERGYRVTIDGAQYLVSDGLLYGTNIERIKGNGFDEDAEIPDSVRDQAADFLDARRDAVEEQQRADGRAYYDTREAQLPTSKKIYEGISLLASAASDFDGYSALFMSQESRQEWSQAVDETMASLYLGSDYWVSALCEQKIDNPTGQQVSLTLTDPYRQYDQTTGFLVASTCTGERQTFRSPINDSVEYLYTITYFVQNPEGYGQPMSYTVDLIDNNGRTVELLQEPVQVEPGQQGGAAGRSSFVRYSTTLYDQCCVQTINGPPLVQGSDYVCNKIVDVTNNEPTFVSGPTVIDGGARIGGSGANTEIRYNII